MTSSPDLERQLRAFRPVAPPALRARVREIAAAEPAYAASSNRGWFRFRELREVLVAAAAVPVVAVVGAAMIGMFGSSARSDELFSDTAETVESPGSDSASTEAFGRAQRSAGGVPTPAPSTLADASGRAQRVSAALAVEVDDSPAVSRAAQDALALTRRLGGYVVSSSITTGEQGNAQLTVRVPVDRVQEAIVGLSALGRIVSQEVQVEDLQEGINASQRRIRSLRAQLAVINARLESETQDAETRARLEARLKTLRAELRGARRTVSTLRAEARMSTIAVTISTPEVFGSVVPSSRLDRTIDKALNVLAWEGVLALAALIVATPFALLALAVWLGRRLHRHREEERLLAT